MHKDESIQTKNIFKDEYLVKCVPDAYAWVTTKVSGKVRNRIRFSVNLFIKIDACAQYFG